MRARLVAAAEAVGDGRRRGARLLRTRDPAILFGAAGYMLFDVAMLGVCFAAFGNDVPPVGVLLVAYIIGQLGSLIPIPGGIGGVDGGLIGTLVLYGVDAADAAVAVIAYRGLLLAIPALLGLPALAVLRRRLRDEAHDIAACAPGESVEVLGRGTVRRPVPVEPASAGLKGAMDQLVAEADAAGMGRRSAFQRRRASTLSTGLEKSLITTSAVRVWWHGGAPLGGEIGSPTSASFDGGVSAVALRRCSRVDPRPSSCRRKPRRWPLQRHEASS